jgi:hypothetical protein
MDYFEDWTRTDRTVEMTLRFCRGEQYTTDQVARICGYVDRRGAWELLNAMSRRLPLIFISGVWRIGDDA